MSISQFFKKFIGTQNEKELKSMVPIVDRINQLENQTRSLSSPELQAKTAEFKQRFSQGESLDSLLPETFAVVREAAWRTIGQRHYDVQLLGGVSLHRGKIAEMRTGEGKTLVATLPTYLNALTGRGVHIITVNDYLAQRDADWMGQIYRFLGLTTGVITQGIEDQQRKKSYDCDITYGTNNEFGFDYLRDNMKFEAEDYVQRELHYCIVDEVDSILIDEARTPLIISGPTEASTDLYYRINQQIGGLIPDTDYTIEEKSKTASLTEVGVEKMEKRLRVSNLYDPTHIELLHHVNQALRAHMLFKKDVDYMVKDGKVTIIDEFTGRLTPGRRWSDGLHQAIEAKENVRIENENQTLASITFQNYFRMYEKLSGMTGTADTEAVEFKQIYQLDVTVIPPHKKMIRIDHADVIYKSETSKLNAVIQEIKRLKEKGQPVLVGTISVEKSENLSSLLKHQGIPHAVLNAKHHQKEAQIIAQAGRKGAITLSTNMAGRGTDILLGGNPVFLAQAEMGPLSPKASEKEKQKYDAQYQKILKKWEDQCLKERQEVIELGGIFILGTERHESRRIDNQLRGRASRQGDPGESRFYLSLQDDLMRMFGGVNIARFMEEDTPIEHKWITRAIENAQRKVENYNYEIRKHLLEYDDVMNQQRKVVYALRKEVLTRSSLREMVLSMLDELSKSISEQYFSKESSYFEKSPLDIQALNHQIQAQFSLPSDIQEDQFHSSQELQALISQMTQASYEAKEKQSPPEAFHQLEKMICLTTIDLLWKDHLLAMDHLREGIGLQGYGHKDPLIEYKKQGYHFFKIMMHEITSDIIKKLFSVQVKTPVISRSKKIKTNQ